MKKNPVIISCDPGVDDAMALLVALNAPRLDIKLIVSSYGNCELSKTTRNALHLVELFGKSTPVAKGSEKPLKREAFPIDAHGGQGLGLYSYEKTNTFPLAGEGYKAMYNILMANVPTKTTILCLGPLTDIAKLLVYYPDSYRHIQEIVFMGGQKDDITKQEPYREVNIALDPEAADLVLSSGVPLVMIPMDLGHMMFFTERQIGEISKINAMGKKFKEMFDGYNDNHVKDAAATHDLCAVLAISNPSFIKTEKARISIEYPDKLNTGCILTKLQSNNYNAKMGMDINIDESKKVFLNMIKLYE